MNHRQIKKFKKKRGCKKYINARADIIYRVVRNIAFDDFGRRVYFEWASSINYKRFWNVYATRNGENHDITDKVYQIVKSPLNI